jgi:hypothetical protein
VFPTFFDTIYKLAYFISRHRAFADVLHDARIPHDCVEAIDVALAIRNEPQA